MKQFNITKGIIKWYNLRMKLKNYLKYPEIERKQEIYLFYKKHDFQATATLLKNHLLFFIILLDLLQKQEIEAFTAKIFSVFVKILVNKAISVFIQQKKF